MDSRSGKVVQVVDSIESRIVNCDLGRFCECVRLVIDRFPFYSASATSDVRIAVRESLEAIIQEVDPEALIDPHGFWMTFLDDVEIGDFSTEDVRAIGMARGGKT